MVGFLCMQTTVCKQYLWPPIALPTYWQGVALRGIRCYYESIYFTIILFYVMIVDAKYNQPNNVVVLSLHKPNAKGVDIKVFLLL